MYDCMPAAVILETPKPPQFQPELSKKPVFVKNHENPVFLPSGHKIDMAALWPSLWPCGPKQRKKAPNPATSVKAKCHGRPKAHKIVKKQLVITVPAVRKDETLRSTSQVKKRIFLLS